MKPRVNLLCTLVLAFCSHSALAVTYPLPPEGSRLVGSTLNITVPENNHLPLEAFAAQHGQGLSNMLRRILMWMSFCRNLVLRWWCHSS